MLCKALTYDRTRTPPHYSEPTHDTATIAMLNTICQADWERSRKELDKAKHDVERLRRAIDRSEAEKRDQQQKMYATRKALQVKLLADI